MVHTFTEGSYLEPTSIPHPPPAAAAAAADLAICVNYNFYRCVFTADADELSVHRRFIP